MAQGVHLAIEVRVHGACNPAIRQCLLQRSSNKTSHTLRRRRRIKSKARIKDLDPGDVATHDA